MPRFWPPASMYLYRNHWKHPSYLTYSALVFSHMLGQFLGLSDVQDTPRGWFLLTTLVTYHIRKSPLGSARTDGINTMYNSALM